MILLLIQNCWLLQAQQTKTIFCHGIVDNKSQADRYQEFLQESKMTFNFPDAEKPMNFNLNNLIFQCCSLFGKSVNRDAMYMGYGQDIETLHKQIESDENYILYGLSRGGSAAINYLAQYNPCNIKALVIDAAPADVVNSIDELQNTMGWKFASDRATQEYIFNALFPAYPIDSKPTIDNIMNIQNNHLPVLIVHAQTDTRVHIRSAWQYYKAFLQAGFTNVYLCQLNDGIHAHYMKGKDKHRYLQAVHSFYKTHGFAHNPEYATMHMRELQPSIQEITNKLQLDHERVQAIYQAQKTFNINTGLTLTAISLIVATIMYNQTN